MVSREEGKGASAPVEKRAISIAALRAIATLRDRHLVAMRASEGGGFEADLQGGRRLSELQASRGGPLPLRFALRILLDTMSGLSVLHRARQDGGAFEFVHGEVTPDNIIVGRDGVARLVPLVKAHWSPATAVLSEGGGYAAPEVLLGDAFDQRADVFSAGVLLWESMSGRALFRGLPVNDIVTRLVGGKVIRPSVAGEDAVWSGALGDVAMRALSVDPGDRWEDVGTMKDSIENIGDGRIAKSVEMTGLVMGFLVPRDSISDEVTHPFALASSLSPFASSIVAEPDEATVPYSPRALVTPSPDSVDPVASASQPSALSTARATAERRWAVVTAALSVGVLALGLVGIKTTMGRRPESSTATSIVVPAAAPPRGEHVATGPTRDLLQPAAPGGASPPPSSGHLEPTAITVPKLPPAVTPLNANLDSKAARGPQKASASSVKPPKSSEDPFGLMKPVRSKAKDDPFGL